MSTSSDVACDTLAIGGVAACELADAYGTPLLVIDTDVLDANIARFERARTELGIDVAYAGKALLFVALARRMASGSLDLDVCSLGELLTAERAGFPAHRLVMHGCGKTPHELRAALARKRTPRPALRVLLRINTGIEARTHAYVRTGGEESKFGFALRDLDAAIAPVLAADGLTLAGIHSHLGSQIFDGAAYTASLPVALDAYALAVARGAPATDLVIGGGFGVDANPAGERIDISGVLGGLAQSLEALAVERGIAPPRLGIEPGRSIVADAGTSLYRVVAVKAQGTRRFAIVDGGIADNPRPALYGAYHHPTLARRSQAALAEMTVCGRSCENDRLVVATLPADLSAGDVLALGTTGAYTYSMASNYNRFPKPAIAFAGCGKHRLVVRREAEADVLRNDLDDAR